MAYFVRGQNNLVVKSLASYRTCLVPALPFSSSLTLYKLFNFNKFSFLLCNRVVEALSSCHLTNFELTVPLHCFSKTDLFDVHGNLSANWPS